MNKQEESYFGIGHLADLSFQSKNFQYVYQLQFVTNLDRAVIEGPLFLNLSRNQTEDTNGQTEDIFYEN